MPDPAIGSQDTSASNLALQAIGDDQIAAEENDECAHKPLITRANPRWKSAFTAVATPRKIIALPVAKDYCRNRSNGVPSAFADG